MPIIRVREVIVLLGSVCAGYVGGSVFCRGEARADDNALVRAHRIELLDATGRVVGRWSAEGSDRASRLCLYPGVDGCQLEIVANDTFAALTMRATRSSVNVSLANVNGRPALNLRDGDTGAALVLGYHSGDTPSRGDYSWALRFLNGAFDTWTAIGTSVNPKTHSLQGFVSVTDERGRTRYLQSTR